MRELWLRMKDHTFFWHPVVTPTFFNLSSIGHEIKLIVSYQSKQIKGNVPLPFFLIAATLLYFYMFFQHNFLFLSIIFSHVNSDLQVSQRLCISDWIFLKKSQGSWISDWKILEVSQGSWISDWIILKVSQGLCIRIHNELWMLWL